MSVTSRYCIETVERIELLYIVLKGNSGISKQWRRNYGDRGYIVPPKFRTCTPCTSQVKILSKRLYKVRTNLYPHIRKRSDAPVSKESKSTGRLTLSGGSRVFHTGGPLPLGHSSNQGRARNLSFKHLSVYSKRR